MAANTPLSPTQTLAASGSIDYGIEFNEFHTRLLRVSLAVEESRAYWQHFRPDIPKRERLAIAFEQQWFGEKSRERVRKLLTEFRHRYESYPAALKILLRWQPSHPSTVQNLCHWHLQLADPLYRDFTGNLLSLQQLAVSKVERDPVARWVKQQLPPMTKWSGSTIQRMATGLLASAADAGVCSDTPRNRKLIVPEVTDEAIAYWLYLLRHLSFKGTLLENPYLASVGLRQETLLARLQKLPGITLVRHGDNPMLEWQYPDLETWATHTLGLTF